MSPSVDLLDLEAWVRGHLSAGLDERLTYHDIAHTIDDVAPAARRLAEAEGMAPPSRRAIEAAALLHDVGFTERYAGHEQASAAIARRVLPRFGFDPATIDRIEGMILATAIDREPGTREQEIVVDADLAVLGRNDFRERNRDLRRELELRGTEYSDLEWYRGQVRFLEHHSFFTEAARARYGERKRANLAWLRSRLLACGGRD